jgi:6-phosphogluconolactonase
MSLTRKILVRNDLDELSQAAAELFVEIAARSIEERGRFSVALSGGSTPRSLYKRLTRPEFRDRVDWTRVTFFFGDERRVPHDSSESNFRMARESLLDDLRIDSDNVHAWDTSNEDPTEAALEYANELKEFFGGRPRFDLVLLGLGSDAHTASLFPHTDALHERKKLAVENWVEKLGDNRFTITFPVINNAANVIFLVSGEDKAQAVADVIEGDFQPDYFPAQFVLPENGDLYWLLDAPAAGLLRNRESLHLSPAET